MNVVRENWDFGTTKTLPSVHTSCSPSLSQSVLVQAAGMSKGRNKREIVDLCSSSSEDDLEIVDIPANSSTTTTTTTTAATTAAADTEGSRGSRERSTKTPKGVEAERGPRAASILTLERRESEAKRKKNLSLMGRNFFSAKPSSRRGKVGNKNVGGNGGWAYDERLGGEVYERSGRQRGTTRGTTLPNFILPDCTLPNYTSYVPDVEKRTHSYDGNFDSYDDAQAEQERLLAGAKERMRRKKENVTSNSADNGNSSYSCAAPPKSFSTPCYVGIKGTESCPPLPTDHHLYKSPYAILGLPEKSSNDLVKRHYKKLCLMYHPDKQRDNKQQHDCTLKFQAVKQAYEALNNT